MPIVDITSSVVREQVVLLSAQLVPPEEKRKEELVVVQNPLLKETLAKDATSQREDWDTRADATSFLLSEVQKNSFLLAELVNKLENFTI